MDTVSRVLSLSPSRQQLKSLISRIRSPTPTLPFALQPHSSLIYAFALLQRLLGFVDSQVLDHTQHFLLECSPQFREMRSPRQLGRLLAAAAMLKRSLNIAIARQSEERHIRISFSRLRIHFPFGSKRVLGILTIFNSFCDREAFGKNHFARAVQDILGNCKPLSLGFVHQISLTEGHVMTYLEFEKEGGFTNADMQLLRSRLAGEIKEHIQPLEPRIYCQRNEEEVYRNAIVLSHELRTIHDIPQVMINYEQLQADDLVFFVLLARPHLMGTSSLAQLWRSSYPSISFVNERTTYLGQFSSGERKEVSIFKLFIPQKNFRCKNSSVDVYAARRFIEQALREILGDFRDYNGGLILKQHENRQKFLDLAATPKSRFFMESFFLSIQPLAMQCTLLPEILHRWHTLVLQTLAFPLQERSAFSLAIHEEDGWLIVSAQVCEASALPRLEEALGELTLASYEKATSWMQEDGMHVFSCAYLTYDAAARKVFLAKIEKTLRSWEAKILSRQHLRINFRNIPHLLDPRLIRSDSSPSLVRMLFEGLLRKTPSGELEKALAKSVHISPDGKTYIFTLRETQWSNGKPLRAIDIEYSWKKALDPRSQSLFAYTFYIIKNARAAHQGLVTPDAIGVRAVDDHTLHVELETPAPHFLESTAHWTYSIIPAEIDQSDPGWAYEEGQRYICNGPFLLYQHRPGQAIILSKNPYYWDASHVKLEKITVHTVQDPLIEKEMFFKGEIDLLSQPVGNLIGDKKYEMLSFPFFSVVFVRCNTRRFPFNNQKIRHAFQEILWHFREKLAKESGLEWEGPAYSLLPRELSLYSPPSHENCLTAAISLFEKGLSELASKREDLPQIDLFFNTPNLEKLAYAAAAVLRNSLHISLAVHKNAQTPYFKRLAEGQYHLSIGTWDSWLNDPVYTLDCFKYQDDPNNTSNWEDPSFITLLEHAANCAESDKRKSILQQAEALLIQGKPIIPLFQKKGAYSKKNNVHGIHLSGNNEIDLKWTFLQ